MAISECIDQPMEAKTPSCRVTELAGLLILLFALPRRSTYRSLGDHWLSVTLDRSRNSVE